MRTTRVVMVAALLLLWGCGEDGSGGGGGGGPGGAGGVDPTLAGITWSSSESALPLGLDHHATWSMTTPAGTYLYAAAGVTDRRLFRNLVHRAPIAPDGTVGAWEELAPTPAPQAGPALAIAGRTVVLAGAMDGAIQSFVLVGNTADDGTIEWSEGPSLPAARFHAAGAASGRFVYVVGGLGEDSSATRTVYRSRVGDDGKLADWETLEPAPEPISHAAVEVHEGFLWVTGGLAGNPNENARDQEKVWRVAVAADGSLGTWERMRDLPRARASHALVIVQRHLVVSGGVPARENNPTSSVIAAPITPAGIGEWREVGRLPAARAHTHHTPLVGGRIHSVGGSYGGESLDSVVVGTPQ